MTALISPDRFYPLAVPATASDRAKDATLDYCTIKATEKAHATLRDLSPLDVMYAFFGSDEVTA